jgi:Cd2+/Zn2+-exporting ATPase
MNRFRFSWIEFLRSADLLMGLTAACAAFGLAGAAARLLHWGPAGLERILFILAYLSGGFGPARDLIRNLSRGQLDINLLMVAAALGSAFIGHWGEGAVLLFLFSLSGALERYTMERTARSIESLIELRPDSAMVLRDGVEVRVRVEEIRVGERVRSIPGERFAVDGVIVEGETSADESTITGESEPVDKAAGDGVFAGTVNLTGAPIVRVTKMPEETTLSRIVRSVQEARRDKSTTERVVDRWQKSYVLSVFAGSALATAFMMVFFQHSFLEAFYHGMILLVAASPCAVVIATPAAMLSAITHAAHHGVLFKGSAHLERLGEVTAIAFDKTGTITEGRPRVVAVVPESPLAAADELIRLGAAVEARSEHHTAKAVVAEAARRGLAVPHATEFESHIGLGTHGRVEGLWVGVGREALFQSHEVAVPQGTLGEAEGLRSSGRSAVLVVARRPAGNGAGDPSLPAPADGVVASGAVGVADTLRPEAKAAIRACRAMGIRHVAIFTGDHARVAMPVAEEVGADELRADLLPEQKVSAVRELLLRWPNLAMVGDGVNDAPALATATVGIAMGGAGTDVALDTADVVLMRDDLRGIAFSLWLARRARRVVSQSLSIAFSVIGVLVLSTVAGILPLWLAVVCHEGSTLIVIANGVRLLGMRHPEFEIR